MELEENPNRPTIGRIERLDVKHHFIVKYKNEEMKHKIVDIILKLINKHEISDFFIEERKAYQKNKIIYNYHTLVTENEDVFNFYYIDEKFVKHLH